MDGVIRCHSCEKQSNCPNPHDRVYSGGDTCKHYKYGSPPKKGETIEKILAALMDERCSKCGGEISYDVEDNVDPHHQVYLSGICTNENCQHSSDIMPTGWKRE